jgi:hypothetical protein
MLWFLGGLILGVNLGLVLFSLIQINRKEK